MEVFFDSTIGRIIVYTLSISSILVAIYLLYLSFKMFKNYFSFNKNIKLNNSYVVLFEFKGFVNKGEIQIGFSATESMKVIVSLIDEKDEIKEKLFDQQAVKGDNIFLFDSTNVENGNYYLNVKTETQNINRKIIIDNSL